MLRTIRSKFQIQEQRIIIKKVIMKSGKNITEDGCKVYIELISFFRDEPRKTKEFQLQYGYSQKTGIQKKMMVLLLTKTQKLLPPFAGICLFI